VAADGSIGAPADPSRWRDARAWFLTRRPVLRESAAQTERDARLRAFRVAGITSVNLVTEVHQAIDDALRDGTTLDEFKKRVGAKLADEWGAPNARRVETIFRTNVQSAYNAGRYAEMTRPAALAVRPFWKFVAILDGRTTATCAPLNGVIAKHDAAFWESHFPPLHFNCRSTVVSLSRGETERAGGAKEPPKAKAPGEGFGTRPDLAGAELAPTENASAPVRAGYQARLAWQPRRTSAQQPTSVRDTNQRLTDAELTRGMDESLRRAPFDELVRQLDVAVVEFDDVLVIPDENGNEVEALAIYDSTANAIVHSPFVGQYRGYFNPGDPYVDEGASTAPDAFGRIMVHELGHAVHAHADVGTQDRIDDLFRAARRAAKAISAYGARNAREYFAESFAAYFFEPEDLRRTDPDAYTLVRAILSDRGIRYDPSRDPPPPER